VLANIRLGCEYRRESNPLAYRATKVHKIWRRWLSRKRRERKRDREARNGDEVEAGIDEVGHEAETAGTGAASLEVGVVTGTGSRRNGDGRSRQKRKLKLKYLRSGKDFPAGPKIF
jgi:hypothetical protein